MAKDFKIKALTRDPDALLGIAALVALALAPADTFQRVIDHAPLFGAIVSVVLGGRFGIRAVGANAEGKVAAVHGLDANVVAAGHDLDDRDLDDLDAAQSA